MIYILKSTLCLALMLAMYFLFLEKEKMYRFNRFYLLFSIVFSYLVPFNSITVYSQANPVLRHYPIQNVGLHNFTTPVKAIQADNNYFLPFLLIIFCLVTSYCLFRFIKNIYLIFLRITKNDVVVLNDAKIVLLQEDIISHTFFNYIFISATQYNEQRIEQEVLIHELAHVRQKHSFDVLFIELLQALFWFNPILGLYKKAIRVNHEFLADEAVIATFNDVKHYQLLLLNKISPDNNISLTSSLNYRVTKKRLIMMTKTANKTRVFFKKLAAVSLVVSAVYVFSARVEAKSNFYPRPKISLSENQDKKSPLTTLTDMLKTKQVPKQPVAANNLLNFDNSARSIIQPAGAKELIIQPVGAIGTTVAAGISIADSAIYLSVNMYSTREQLNDYQAQLAKKNITLVINQIEFDAENNISYLKLAVNCHDGFSGGCSTYFSNPGDAIGFYRIYRAHADSPFGTGGMSDMIDKAGLFVR